MKFYNVYLEFWLTFSTNKMSLGALEDPGVLRELTETNLEQILVK